MKTCLPIALLCVFVSFFGACRKNVNDTQTEQSRITILDSAKPINNIDTSGLAIPAYPQHPNTGCFPSPIYGDSVVYIQPTNGTDYILHPVNDPGPGRYLSWPTGLALDPSTGAIDVSKSLNGTRYAIGYVKAGTHDTCLTQLILGGADYMDSIYVVGSGSPVALPFFNANAYLASDCDRSGGSGHCSFDINGSAQQKKLYIDKHTGEIDIAKSLNGDKKTPGIFGSSPVNGSSVMLTIYYQLQKGSNNATQRVDIQLVYYDTQAAVSSALQAEVQVRLEAILDGTLISTGYSKRPPLIVIVRKTI